MSEMFVWNDIDKCKPPEYEMCELVTLENKVRKGWRSGTHYDGINVKDTDEIIKWRRIISYQSKK
jgi:hypothetical protein